MLFGKTHKAPVIVVRDGLDILKAAQEALLSAAPGERPGLERAVSIIEAQCARTQDDVLNQWVRGFLVDAGVDAVTHHVEAVAALRKALPELSLITANDLVTNATGQ